VVIAGFSQRSRLEAWARDIVSRQAELRQISDEAES
jgi:hypothetical protein